MSILLSFATDRLAQPYDSRNPKQFSCPLATPYPPALAMKLGNTRHNFTAPKWLHYGSQA